MAKTTATQIQNSEDEFKGLNIITDLHCHPSLNPFNSSGDIWKYDPPRERQRDNLINTLITSNFSQTDFTSQAKGDVRLVLLSLYPIEHGFLTNLLSNPLFKNKATAARFADTVMRGLIMDVLSRFGLGSAEHFLSKAIFNMKGKRFKEMTAPDRDYFNDLMGEYEFLISKLPETKVINGKTYQIKIVRNYADLKDTLKIDDNYNVQVGDTNYLCIVLTIEGAHAFGCGIPKVNIDNDINKLNNLSDPDTKKLLAKLETNIKKVKNLENGAYCPFFVTLSHHFWNQLCGHSMSLAGIMHSVFNQKDGMSTGLTAVGEKVVEMLLSKKNGKRILIDIKHMSVEGRQQYYQILDLLNEDIPIIASHMGVNAHSTMDQSRNMLDHFVMDESYNETGWYNNWDINLSDEEILRIHKSNGLIGLNMDQRILSGKKMIDTLNRISGGIKEKTRSVIYRSIWAEPILANLLYIVRTIARANPDEKDAVWQYVGIGSDFDGMINALDAYCHFEDLKVLKGILCEKLKLRAQHDMLLKGKTVKDLEEIIDGFMYKNALIFLERNFN